METNSNQPERRASGTAPWWVYVGAIVAANFGRQQLIDPDEVGTATNIALLAVVTAVVVLVIWLGHRALTSR